MNRKEILEAAAKTICVDRQDAYGRPEDSAGYAACGAEIAGRKSNE